jgi:hypothetical protein
MPQREIHLPGALPFDTEAEAIRTVLANPALAEHLLTMPDGEPGYRSMWIGPELLALTRLPSIVTGNPTAGFTDYEDVLRFSVAPGHTLTAEQLSGCLLLKEAVTRSYPLFQQIREETGRRGIRFQAGLPSPPDLAWLAFGDAGLQPGIYRAVARAKADAVNACAAGRPDVAFHIEMPTATVAVIRTPEAAQQKTAEEMARLLAEFGEMLDPGIRVMFHLCYGDLHHRKITGADSAAPLVLLANAVAAAWPGQIDLFHFPIAQTEDPPSRQLSWYAPFGRLAVGNARVAAGLVHESLGEPEHREIIDMTEQAMGRKVALSPPCGLGRRSTRREALTQMVVLAELAAE